MPVYVSKDWDINGGLAVVSAKDFESAVKAIVNSDIVDTYQGNVIRNMREIKEGEVVYEYGVD